MIVGTSARAVSALALVLLACSAQTTSGTDDGRAQTLCNDALLAYQDTLAVADVNGGACSTASDCEMITPKITCASANLESCGLALSSTALQQFNIQQAQMAKLICELDCGVGGTPSCKRLEAGCVDGACKGVVVFP